MYTAIAGVLCVFLGFLLRYKAIKTLGSSFSLSLQRRKHIVTTGIYKYIRHPSYTGSILVVFGFSALWPPLGVAYLAFMFFLSRAVREEIILGNADYKPYKEKTGMFLPRIKLWQR